MLRQRITLFGLLGSCFLNLGCKKLVEIPPPSSVVTQNIVFSSDNQATSAMAGVYSLMINTGISPNLCDGSLPVYCGMSADELVPFSQDPTAQYIQFANDSLLVTNAYVTAAFWTPGYSIIYGCNAVIAGVASSTGIHDSVKNELTGEAKFIRALCNFYLTNIYGAIPLILTTDYNETSLLLRSAPADVYKQIISDLIDAQIVLPEDYSVGNGNRVIPNKWAATALLARIYLFEEDYLDAEIASNAVLSNTSLFSLSPTINGVFLANNSEAIFQLQQASNNYPYNGTVEGYTLIPHSSLTPPFAYMTSALLNAFEINDQRRVFWIDSTNYNGITYYFPYKYQLGASDVVPNGNITQSYMVLRLAEQYLIRAEAEANGANGGVSAAIADLNVIRNRAGLPNYSGPTDQPTILTTIYHERQIELFSEWGHRWLDLKRWGTATAILSAEKGITVSSNALLYPIAISELSTDPNLTQNPGYN